MYKKLPNISVNLNQSKSQITNTAVPLKNTIICKALTGPINKFTRLTSYNEAINIFGIGDASTPAMHGVQEVLKSYSYVNIIRVTDELTAAAGTITINLADSTGTPYDPVIPVITGASTYKTEMFNGDEIVLLYDTARTRIGLKGTLNGVAYSTPLEIIDLTTATADMVEPIIQKLVDTWNTFDAGFILENKFINKTDADQTIIPTDIMLGTIQLGDSGNTGVIENQAIINALQLVEDPKIEKQDFVCTPEFRNYEIVNAGIALTNKFFFITCAEGTTLTEKVDAISLFTKSDASVCYIPSKCTFNNTDIVVPFELAVLYAWAKSYSVSKYLAPAGTTRTTMPLITDIIDNLADADAEVLYNNSIPANPVKYLSGHGYTLYGQRTMDPEKEYTSKINVSGLVNFIQVEATTLLTPYIFEYTPISTFQQVNLDLSKLFDTLVANNAIYNDYQVICDDSNNSVETLANNELHVAVAVRPLNVAEYIILDLTVTDQIGGDY